GESIVPGNLGERAGAFRADSPQRAGQAERRIAPGAVIGDGALAAELAARDGMGGIAENFGDDPVLFIYGDTAGIIAIARTSGFANFLLQHRGLGLLKATLDSHKGAIYFVSQLSKLDKFSSRPL